MLILAFIRGQFVWKKPQDLQEGNWWNTGGTLVGCWWDTGGTLVGCQWNAGGTLVGGLWDAGGTLVGRWWDAGGTLVEGMRPVSRPVSKRLSRPCRVIINLKKAPQPV